MLAPKSIHSPERGTEQDPNPPHTGAAINSVFTAAFFGLFQSMLVTC